MKSGRLDHGQQLQWYPNGQVSLKTQYTNGEQEGYTESWYENGQMEYTLQRKDGLLHNEYLAWYENGSLYLEAKLIEGSGTMVFHSPDGSKKSSGILKDGERWGGTFTDWYDLQNLGLIFGKMFGDE